MPVRIQKTAMSEIHVPLDDPAALNAWFGLDAASTITQDGNPDGHRGDDDHRQDDQQIRSNNIACQRRTS